MSLLSVSAAVRAAHPNPLLRRSPHPVRLAVAAAITLAVLIVVGMLLRAVPVDLALSVHLHAWRAHTLGAVTEGFYRSLKPEPAAAIMCAAAVVAIVATRRWQIALVFVGSIATTWGGAELLKLVVDRPRPGLTEFAHRVSERPVDASFPSGHVAFTAALAAALIVVFWGSRARVAVIVLGAALVAMMSFSVVVVGVHYLGDAAASVVWVAGVFPIVRVGWARGIVPAVERLARRRQTA